MDNVNELPEVNEDEEDDGYESLFRNFDDENPQQHPDADALEQSASEENAEPQVDEPAASEAAPDNKDPETDANSASGSTGKETSDDDSWMNELSEEARARVEALRHRDESHRGRTSALQRRLNEAEARLEAQRQAAEKGRPNGAAQKPNATPSNETDSESLKEFKEKYPALAKSVEELIGMERQRITSELSERLSPIESARQEEAFISAREKLEQGAAELFDTANTGIDYRDVVESEFYKDTFLKSQPAIVRQTAENTSDPEEALWVLKQFADFAQDYAAKNPENAEAVRLAAKADRTKARRAQQKGEATRVASVSSPTGAAPALSYEEEFAAMGKEG